MEALVDEGKTVTQLAALTGLALPETMYYLMTLLRFGDIEVEGLDDSDEYYWYKRKARK
jgi:hypothetical protein